MADSLSLALFQDAVSLAKTDINLAVAKLTSVISFDGKHDRAYTQRGLLYTKLNEYRKAIYDFTRAIEIKPSPLLYEYRGLAYSSDGQYKKAVNDFDLAIAKSSSAFYHLYLHRGVAKVKLSDRNGALDDITRSIKLSPDYPRGYDLRAQIYCSLNLYRLAIVDIESAMKLDPSNFKYRETYNEILSIDRSSLSLLDRIALSFKK